MTWLKRRWERLCAWANAEPKDNFGIGVLLAVWAFALAMNGGAVFRSGITLDAVISFGGYLLLGALVWGVWAAMNELLTREKTNLRRAVVLAAVIMIATTFASQINMFG